MTIMDKLGHSSRRQSSAASSVARSSHDEPRDPAPNGGEDETVIDEAQGSIITHLISQLRPGADLSRVTLPTFFLEPRSMLERITNFMAHPETLLPMPDIDDPVQRFISVVKFYLSGWHIRPPGVKKPLNPILGETYTCYWQYPDKSYGYYISEQTSHHPPKSSYFFMAPEHNIRIDGTLKPRSKFLGNSAASMMEGIAVMRFLNRKERYFITQPNIYSRGILFGKLKYELGDHSSVRCPELGLEVDIEFKTKGYFGGTYNAIGGFIKDSNSGKQLYELSGLWTSDMYIKDLATAHRTLLFSVAANPQTPPMARPIPEQEERESQRLWKKVTDAVKKKDQDAATDEKTRIEDMQREEAAKRAEEGTQWQPRLFRAIDPDGRDNEDEEKLDWIINAEIDGTTHEEQNKQILSIAGILPGQKSQHQDQGSVSTGAEAIEQAIDTERVPAVAVPTGRTQTDQSHEDLINLDHEENAAQTAQQPPPPSAPKQDQQGASLLDGPIPPPKDGEPGHALVPALEKMKLSKEQDDTPGPGKLRRIDTETKTLDEFVDAES